MAITQKNEKTSEISERDNFTSRDYHQMSETDIIPIKLTESQFRILMQLLKKAQPMSTKEIEREVHTAYLMENSTPSKKLSPQSFQTDKIRKLAKNEQERIKAVAELNKKFDLNIPSYRKIESELYRLNELGLVEFAEYRTAQAKTKANRYWSLDPLFYERWLQRKGIIANEYHTKGIQFLRDKYPGRILEFYQLMKVL